MTPDPRRVESSIKQLEFLFWFLLGAVVVAILWKCVG